MTLTPEQQKEMAELEELDHLEGKFGQNQATPMSNLTPKQQELVSTMKSPPSPDLRNVMEGIQGGAIGEAVGSGVVRGAKALSPYLPKGIHSLADYLSQKSMGLKKYIPGVGTTALEEGVYGTKSQMQNRIGHAIENKSYELNRAVSNLDPVKKVTSEHVADALQKEANPYTTRSGQVPSEGQPFVNIASKRAEEALSREPMSPMETLDLKRTIARPAYKEGEPLSSFAKQLSQKEALGYGQELENLGASQGMPGEISGTNKTLSELLKGKKALNQPTKIKSLGVLDYATLGAKPALGSPLVTSQVARGLQGISKSGYGSNIAPTLSNFLNRDDNYEDR